MLFIVRAEKKTFIEILDKEGGDFCGFWLFPGIYRDKTINIKSKFFPNGDKQNYHFYYVKSTFEKFRIWKNKSRLIYCTKVRE